MAKVYPIRPPRRPRDRARYHREIMEKRLERNPAMAIIAARAIELLKAEEGIMLREKLLYVLTRDAEVEKAFKEYPNEENDNLYSAVRAAFMAGESLGYWENTSNEVPAWFPMVVKLPGVARTVPKIRYLGLDVD